jgi:hypothetical protein
MTYLILVYNLSLIASVCRISFEWPGIICLVRYTCEFSRVNANYNEPKSCLLAQVHHLEQNFTVKSVMRHRTLSLSG